MRSDPYFFGVVNKNVDILYYSCYVLRSKVKNGTAKYKLLRSNDEHPRMDAGDRGSKGLVENKVIKIENGQMPCTYGCRE